jgi:hypothetical protein
MSLCTLGIRQNDWCKENAEDQMIKTKMKIRRSRFKRQDHLNRQERRKAIKLKREATLPEWVADELAVGIRSRVAHVSEWMIEQFMLRRERRLRGRYLKNLTAWR